MLSAAALSEAVIADRISADTPLFFAAAIATGTLAVDHAGPSLSDPYSAGEAERSPRGLVSATPSCPEYLLCTLRTAASSSAESLASGDGREVLAVG